VLALALALHIHVCREWAGAWRSSFTMFSNLIRHHLSRCPPGEVLLSKAGAHSHSDIHHSLLLPCHRVVLDDDEEVAQDALLACRTLTALLPPETAARATLFGVERLQAHATETALVHAVRLFGLCAGSLPQTTVEAVVPALVSAWVAHRDFAVREVSVVSDQGFVC